MKTAKNRLILLVIAMALVLSLSLGLTFAYFSDHKEAKGGATLTLGGKTEIVENYDKDSKTVSIKNIGQTDVLVRVGIYGPSTTTIEFSENDWIKIGDYYYYRKVLAVDGSTSSSITASITGPAGSVENFDVVVVNECMQVTYNEDGSIATPSGWPQGFLN